jgi:hypothetical protein
MFFFECNPNNRAARGRQRDESPPCSFLRGRAAPSEADMVVQYDHLLNLASMRSRSQTHNV